MVKWLIGWNPAWVPGLRIDPLCLLSGCRRRRLNQAPLNLRGVIWLLMMDWSKRGNINIAALVTIVQCNTLVVRCSTVGSLWAQQIGFLSYWGPYAVISLEAVACSSYCNTVVLVGLKPISVANWLLSVLLQCLLQWRIQGGPGGPGPPILSKSD